MTEGGRSFAVTTRQLWKSLSLELRNSVSLDSFKNYHRNNLFDVQQTTSFYCLTFDYYLLSSYVLFSFTIRLLLLYCVSLVRIFLIEGHKFISFLIYSVPPSLNKVYYYYYMFQIQVSSGFLVNKIHTMYMYV